uniref:Uncharacterized protein n=1 Tax=Caudovirales sp. ctrNG92 TaxID=2827638 RepID=A0A8S5SE08_9CAUD|nr:MAG TPA: hypothetical protein [Caudovirales sp. ctrNG92]
MHALCIRPEPSAHCENQKLHKSCTSPFRLPVSLPSKPLSFP